MRSLKILDASWSCGIDQDSDVMVHDPNKRQQSVWCPKAILTIISSGEDIIPGSAIEQRLPTCVWTPNLALSLRL